VRWEWLTLKRSPSAEFEAQLPGSAKFAAGPATASSIMSPRTIQGRSGCVAPIGGPQFIVIG
jgi:hypothetical protein